MTPSMTGFGRSVPEETRRREFESPPGYHEPLFRMTFKLSISDGTGRKFYLSLNVRTFSESEEYSLLPALLFPNSIDTSLCTICEISDRFLQTLCSLFCQFGWEDKTPQPSQSSRLQLLLSGELSSEHPASLTESGIYGLEA